MKARRADGCVKIKVVGVSGRTHGRKASFDEEKESVERKERESTCVMETEGYGDSDQNEIILDGKDNKIKEDEKSVMENKMEQVPVMENTSVMEKEGDQDTSNGKPECDRKGRASGYSNGKPECDRKRRGSDHHNGKSECDGKVCF